MAGSTKDLILQALKKTEPKLAALWESSADNFGWDKQSAAMVKAKANEQGVKLAYDPDMAQKIFDIEYGYKKDAPKPAMREFSAASKAHLDQAINEALGQQLKGTL